MIFSDYHSVVSILVHHLTILLYINYTYYYTETKIANIFQSVFYSRYPQ